MFKRIIRSRLAAFEKAHDYDMSYARALLEADLAAFLAFAKVMPLTRYRRGVPPEVYWAAKLTATLREDCGPCAQLCIGLATRDGVAEETLCRLVRGELRALDADTRLGAEYARAVADRSPDVDFYGQVVVERFGRRALASLALAVTAARIFPTLKVALGHGSRCARLSVGGRALVAGIESAA
ncbi:MAG TPA: hypothetical protein PK095_16445 [Myxococcota bacterium]|nr:hypothetical protein [Myxococcota bacterium]